MGICIVTSFWEWNADCLRDLLSLKAEGLDVFSESKSMIVERTAETVFLPVAANAFSVDYYQSRDNGVLPAEASKHRTREV